MVVVAAKVSLLNDKNGYLYCKKTMLEGGRKMIFYGDEREKMTIVVTENGKTNVFL